jgi:hypothetical protein
MRAVLLALVLALAVPATAAAGGFATVGLAPPPAGVGPGDSWNAELTVLQHGRTPMEGPVSVVIRRPDGSEVNRFSAEPTDKPGVYRAEIVFPAGGEWRYAAVDPFGVEHGFPTVALGDPRAAPSVWPALVAALDALIDGLRVT